MTSDRYSPAAPGVVGSPVGSRPAHRLVVTDHPTDLAALIQHAARHVRIDIATDDGGSDQGGARLRFGTQIDTQPLTAETPTAQAIPKPNDTARTTASRLSPRRVAAYLAKYVTKSLHDFGITARRLIARSDR